MQKLKRVSAFGAAIAAAGGGGWIYRRTKNDIDTTSITAEEPSTCMEEPNGGHTHKVKFTSTVPNATSKKLELAKAIKRCNKLIRNAMVENGVPGATAAISINGHVVYNKAFGLSDVENNVACRPENVMRIASISKPLTAVAALQLVEEGKLDLDAAIQKYVPDFPEKKFNGESVTMTTRQLLCHTAGIRHYHTSDEKGNDFEEQKEYFITKNYESVKDSLELFANDDLISRPGNLTGSFTMIMIM